LEQSNQAVLRELEDDHARSDLLEGSDVHCPLCNHSLDTTAKEQLWRERETRARDMQAQHARNLEEIDRLNREYDALRDRVADREASLEQSRRKSADSIAALSRDLREANEALELLKPMGEQFERLITIVASDDFAQEERRKLGDIEARLESLGFDGTKRSKLHERMRLLEAEKAGLETELNAGQSATQGRLLLLERELQEADCAERELSELQPQLEQLKRLIAAKSFAQQERRRLAEIAAQVAPVVYDPAKHRKTREQVQNLERYDELHRSLTEAAANLPAAKETLDAARTMLQRREDELRLCGLRLEQLCHETAALAQSERELTEGEGLNRDLQRQHNDLLVRRGILIHQIERCNALQIEITILSDRRDNLCGELEVFEELARAFGKSGVQAMIVASVIPQIEADANELLARLTDGRMSVRLLPGIEKSPTFAELEIAVSDELGTRSYETFSGGEAFRVNFALRIALSKLLAKRAGAPLPVLFIDEGFGSQDSFGQQRLVEAIRSIQDDFEKIIVITHVERIKEAFPIRIEVTKTEAGSSFVLA
jgi:exonuclease SbcC